MKVLFIDNFDSFTYNLVEEFRKRKCSVLVYRNDTAIEMIEQAVKKFRPNLIVISPGPSSPENAGNSMEIIKNYFKKIPIFGVCLGHQCIIEAFGGKVDKAPEPTHGKDSAILHDKKTIFRNLESHFHAGRYHSLAGLEIPDSLEVSARTEDNIVMAIRHKKHFVEGVQFHPESILTPCGGKIIENLIWMVKND